MHTIQIDFKIIPSNPWNISIIFLPRIFILYVFSSHFLLPILLFPSSFSFLCHNFFFKHLLLFFLNVFLYILFLISKRTQFMHSIVNPCISSIETFVKSVKPKTNIQIKKKIVYMNVIKLNFFSGRPPNSSFR